MKIDAGKMTKKELIAYIVANKAEILHLKKSATKHTDPYFLDSKTGLLLKDHSANKIITSDNKDREDEGIIYRTVVGNTYGWMDSHMDVHIPGIFSKSISENKNIAHLHDHMQMLTAKVGKPLKIYEHQMSWKSLGVDKKGMTTCLLMDSEIRKDYNAQIYQQYLEKEINQHSVGMIYVHLFLCINDDEYKEEFANWNTYEGYVGNLDEAEEHGYFWAVTEAKLREISAVIAGSNELTPTIQPKLEPITVTPKAEPPTGTQIDYEYLNKHIKQKLK